MIRWIDIADIRRSLALVDFDVAAARQRMAPAPRGWQKRNSPPKRAAVMILLFLHQDSRLHVVLTLRNAGLRGHSGQVSFPGGHQDPKDASLTATALRETCEEIGVSAEGLEVLGRLPRFYIPASHYEVYPSIACYDGAPAFAPNPDEVQEVFSFALEDLLRPRFKCAERRCIRGHEAHVPFYSVAGHKVWGATAMLLSELEGRLRQVLPKAVLLELA